MCDSAKVKIRENEMNEQDRKDDEAMAELAEQIRHEDCEPENECEGRVECECGEPECPEPCQEDKCEESCDQEQPCENAVPMIGANQVFLNMQMEDGQTQVVDMATVMQTIWSVLMDIDRRICEIEGTDEEEESPIITL